MIKLELPTKLHPVFTGPARYRVAHGGRGSAKSWAFARMCAIKAYEKPRRILCARELQNSIKESVHKLLSDQIAALKLPGFQIGESFIRHVNGSEFIFKGLRTNSGEIKSMEGIDICWVEEAQAVSEESWKVLIPTIRAAGSEIWVTFNPKKKTDPTSQRFIENPLPDSRIARINYLDNPWFPAELRKEMEYQKRVDNATYLHVWEGEYEDPNKAGRVCYSWSIANIEDVQYNPKERLYLTCDFNVDPMCWAIAHKPTIDGKNHYHFFDEIVRENSNIMAAARQFAEKYGKHKAGIIITGDASGRQRSDMAEEENQTRYDLLRRTLSDMGVTNFSLNVNRSNPKITSRLERWNEMLSDQDDNRRVLVSPKCKQIIHICEEAKYKPGESEIWQPTSKQIEENNAMKFLRDDMLDAVSYLVWKFDPKVNRDDVKETQAPEIIFDV